MSVDQAFVRAWPAQRAAVAVALLSTIALAVWTAVAGMWAPASLAVVAACTAGFALAQRPRAAPAAPQVEKAPAEPAVVPAPALEALPDAADVLDYVQDVLEAHMAGEKEIVVMKISRLPRVLQRNGIDVVTFDGSNETHFEFFKAVTPETREFRTLRPALLVNGRLGRIGTVVRPYGDA